MASQHIDLEDLDHIIHLLDNSINGVDNRSQPRKKTDLDVYFTIKSASGAIKRDLQQPPGGSKMINLSKGGAAITTRKRFNVDDAFWIETAGANRFHAKLVVVNHSKADNAFRYGCRVLSLKIIR